MGSHPLWLVSLQEENIWTYTETPGVQAHGGGTMLGHKEKVAICKPRREASEEINPANTLILDFQPQELWGNQFLMVKPVSGIVLQQPREHYFILSIKPHILTPTWQHKYCYPHVTDKDADTQRWSDFLKVTYDRQTLTECILTLESFLKLIVKNWSHWTSN